MCLPTLLIVYPRTCICLCPLTSLVARSSRSFVNVYLRALLGVCLILYLSLCLDVFFPSVCEISCILASFCIGLYVGILRIHFHVSVPRFPCVSMAVPASVSFLFFCVFVCLSVSIGMSDCVCVSMSVSTSFMDHLKNVLHRKNLPLIPLQVFNQLAIIVSVEDFSSYYLINICL